MAVFVADLMNDLFMHLNCLMRARIAPTRYSPQELFSSHSKRPKGSFGVVCTFDAVVTGFLDGQNKPKSLQMKPLLFIRREIPRRTGGAEAGSFGLLFV